MKHWEYHLDEIGNKEELRLVMLPPFQLWCACRSFLMVGWALANLGPRLNLRWWIFWINKWWFLGDQRISLKTTICTIPEPELVGQTRPEVKRPYSSWPGASRCDRRQVFCNKVSLLFTATFCDQMANTYYGDVLAARQQTSKHGELFSPLSETLRMQES